MAGFVGFVGCPPATIPKNEGDDQPDKPQAEPLRAVTVTPPGSPTHEAAPATAWDSDRWCWPNSPAMNTREIDTFTARLALFTDKGESLDDAERLADRLVIRDRERDNRRLCLECAHLQGYGRWRCGNWQAADVARQGLAGDLVLMLQRCRGFAGWQGLIERRTNDQA
jgi:hypothetical protein